MLGYCRIIQPGDIRAGSEKRRGVRLADIVDDPEIAAKLQRMFSLGPGNVVYEVVDRNMTLRGGSEPLRIVEPAEMHKVLVF